MAIPIDTSTPFLRPSQLEALIRAVVQADPHDEHDWIEWKSSLDLDSPEGRFHAVKQILGFSNRTVEAARRNAGGHGYLLVGVEPGNVTGVTSVDNADLQNGIDRYVSGVRWSPERVTVDGRTVLVIVVFPPKPGDTINPLRKGHDKVRSGAVFVRVAGKSEQANPAQLDGLVARAAQDVLDVGVDADQAMIETGPAPREAQFDEVVAAHRAHLMSPSRSTLRPPSTTSDALNLYQVKVSEMTRGLAALGRSRQGVATPCRQRARTRHLPPCMGASAAATKALQSRTNRCHTSSYQLSPSLRPTARAWWWRCRSRLRGCGRRSPRWRWVGAESGG